MKRRLTQKRFHPGLHNPDDAAVAARQMTGGMIATPTCRQPTEKTGMSHTFTLDGQDHSSSRVKLSFRPPVAGVLHPGISATTWNSSRMAVQALYRQDQRPADGLLHHAADGRMVVESETEELNAERRALTQMLSLSRAIISARREERQLPVAGHRLNTGDDRVRTTTISIPTGLSMPRTWTCCRFQLLIFCSLCASRDVDGKNVFALSGRVSRPTIVNAKSG